MFAHASEIRVATFNVSMEAENYVGDEEKKSEKVLIERLQQGDEAQIQAIARIIQLQRPDIILLTEFDYIEDPAQGVEAFLKNYLAVSQQGADPIHYEHYFYDEVNTGQPSPYDLNRDGKTSGTGADAWGYGLYPGQYGMLVLSRYPIVEDEVRTFRHFKWKDMPDHKVTLQEDGSPWYSEQTWQEFPLSSKSHWDVPVQIGEQTIHVLASHPTPPVFDGPENRNGKRNHDEIRFWTDYITENQSDYIYDDQGRRGGFSGDAAFLIMGDLNSSPVEGDSIQSGIIDLLKSPAVQGEIRPLSRGGAEHTPDNPHAATHTASWRSRVDYVIPSARGLQVTDSGVFWPARDEDDYELVASRSASSDHRLVWLQLKLQ